MKQHNHPSPPNRLSRSLLLQAANNRHGLTLEPQRAVLSMSDVSDIVHVGVPGSIASPWQSAAGGIGLNEEDAQLAAIGEAVERYCATVVELPLKARSVIEKADRIDPGQWCLFSAEQRRDPHFPFGAIYKEHCLYSNVYDFQDGAQMWVPHPLVALRDDFQTGIPTSSGLAAGPSAGMALLRAIQELIERDALMTTWLHSVPARAVAAPMHLLDKVMRLHGEMWVFDLTPAYSPFPVVAVAGGIPKQGKWRYSLGVACRETWDAALEKAYLEWNQGVLFAGIYEKYVDVSGINDPHKLKSFDEHAIYYTLHPDQWHELPMFSTRTRLHQPSVKGRTMTVAQTLKSAKRSLKNHGIRMYYRDLTTLDADQIGVRVVRACSPDLAPIFAHQAWPLVGGVKSRLRACYPWAPRRLTFPNLMPHPLG